MSLALDVLAALAPVATHRLATRAERLGDALDEHDLHRAAVAAWNVSARLHRALLWRGL